MVVRVLANILLLCLMVPVCVFVLAANPEPARASADPDGRPIRLELETHRCDKGRGSIIVRFRNVSDQPVTILRPLDGSSWGWYMPGYRFTVTDEAGNELGLSGRCGVSGLWHETTWPDSYLVEIPAGSTHVMRPHVPYQIEHGMAYTVTMEYVVDPDALSERQKAQSLEIPAVAWAGSVKSEPITASWSEATRQQYEWQSAIHAPESVRRLRNVTAEQIAQATKRSMATLRHLFGAPITGRDQAALERAQVLMLYWRGTGYDAGTIAKILGEPTEAGPDALRYTFANGMGWRFLLTDGVVTGVEAVWP